MESSKFIVDITKVPSYKVLTEEDLKEEEKELDIFSLKNRIMVKGKIIKTYGELRPYIKSTKIARKFEDFLDEDDFQYFFNWILHKEIIEEKKKFKN